MHRIALSNNARRWFDRDAARSWDEDTYHDGSNNISCATDSQWEHERLYLTRTGVWVLECWGRASGGVSGFIEVSRQQAAVWLILNSEEPPECLTSALEETEI